MSDVPIRRLMVSDFRRIEGTRDLPLDAPVVLIHGPNGSGKTSVLSALELALTGAVRSMERQSDRYRAHLPFLGQAYATVRADVAEDLQAGTPGAPLTVNGARLEGTPALNPDAAKFYAERCYLDQTSLARLLDLYEVREVNGQTALEKFVNELLGLEKLDALRTGLVDANDFRLFKRLAVGVDEADREAKAGAQELQEQTALRAKIRDEVAATRTATREAVHQLGRVTREAVSDDELLEIVSQALNDDTTALESAAAVTLHQELIALSGRISALVERPTMQRLEETRAALAAAIAEEQAWEAKHGARIREWEASAQSVGIDLAGEPTTAVEFALRVVAQELESAANVRAESETIRAQSKVARTQLEKVQSRLAQTREQSSALVEGLAAIRGLVGDSNICPVCDRDFTETGQHSLLAHIDTRLEEIANHGQQLVDLRNEQDLLVNQISRLENDQARLSARILSSEQHQAVERRHASLVGLAANVQEVAEIRSQGTSFSRRVRSLQKALEDLEAAAQEERRIASELTRFGAALGIEVVPAFDSFRATSAELLEAAKAESSRLTNQASRYRQAEGAASRLRDAREREGAAVQQLAEAAERKRLWDDRVTEARRRQGVAKDVREAATQARTKIVHRVFTESLNEVWKTVFTRLAPNEGFVPSFGIPSATKKTFDIKLETTYRNGEASGPPQMMLSAGNLNTAALSLFLALHLAVEPVVPCLVFDDPVQAMDEVHVAQFAGLIRVLSKQNNRQVIIAVHERELFDYLALELSPAYPGDELITIELGERTKDEDQGITRHLWAPDAAIAN